LATEKNIHRNNHAGCVALASSTSTRIWEGWKRMIYQHIATLVETAIEIELIKPEDRIYARKQVLSQLKITEFPDTAKKTAGESIPEALEAIVDYAVEHHIIPNALDATEILRANVMNCFVARPSVINQTFDEQYQISPRHATDYFYALSRNSNYIQTERVKKNIHYQANTMYGE